MLGSQIPPGREMSGLNPSLSLPETSRGQAAASSGVADTEFPSTGPRRLTVSQPGSAPAWLGHCSAPSESASPAGPAQLPGISWVLFPGTSPGLCLLCSCSTGLVTSTLYLCFCTWARVGAQEGWNSGPRGMFSGFGFLSSPPPPPKGTRRSRSGRSRLLSLLF